MKLQAEDHFRCFHRKAYVTVAFCGLADPDLAVTIVQSNLSQYDIRVTSSGNCFLSGDAEDFECMNQKSWFGQEV